MNASAIPAPDFERLLQAVVSPPTPPVPPAPTGEQPRPHADWPALDGLMASLEAVFRVRSDVIGSFKSIGKARLQPDGSVLTHARRWEFQGWLPFASRRVVRLGGALVRLEFEVLAGEIMVALLADHGSHTEPERYVAGPGRHAVQLPVNRDEVRGIVFSTTDADREPSRFVVRSAVVLQLDDAGPAAAELQRLVRELQTAPPPETNDPTRLPASVSLLIFHLLARGELHRCHALLHAIRSLAGELPAALSPRLEELLARHIGVPLDLASPAAAPTPPSVPSPPPPAAWAELWPLRRALAGASIVPLHFELLEFGETVALLDHLVPRNLQLRWRRRALAATPVPRGLLRSLLLLLLERQEDRNGDLRIEATTSPDGTEIKLHTQLREGDLQYRTVNPQSDALHQLLNHPCCPAPELQHRLGEENQLALRWPGPQPAAADTELHWPDRGRADAATVALHHGESGTEINRRDARCIKLGAPAASKANAPLAEARLLASLADCDFVPRLLAAEQIADRSALSYAFAAGTELAAIAPAALTDETRARIVARLSDALTEVNRRGIQHRDVRAENVLLREDGTIVLLDFDQARPFADSTPADDFGNQWGKDEVCVGFGGLIRQLGWSAAFLRSAGRMGFAWELGRLSAANSPGKHACYYQWRWGPLELTGERPWAQRWRLLGTAFRGHPPGTFLELGCNLGLLSTYAALEGWHTTGLDHDGVAVAGATEIAATLGTTSTFRQADLTAPDFAAPLDDTYDLVSALSVVHWLPDPAPVEAFLRRQPRLLFEGHRAIADEEAYLHTLGFDSVSLLGYSERLRPVLLACRTS